MSRRWIIPLAALALLVPVGAVALDRSSSGLGVQASLGSCGVADDSVFCEISASFDRLDGADFYTATLTRPDSTIQDFGRVADGESGRATVSLWIPYSGNGSYTVEVTAWALGADGEPEELARESNRSNGNRGVDQAGSGENGSAQPGSPGLETPAAIEEQALPPACGEGQPDESQADASEPANGVEGADSADGINPRDESNPAQGADPGDGATPSGDPDGNADQQAEAPTGDTNPDSGEPTTPIDPSGPTGDEPANSADCEELPTGTD